MLFTFFVGSLTAILVLNCLFLLLLILIQLPKKEAGLGQAFGSGATDALFGAGSGTALTKMTKYATVVFFVLTFSLALLNAQQSKDRRTGKLGKLVEAAAKKEATAPSTPAPVAPATAASNAMNLKLVATNLVAAPKPSAEAPVTNSAPKLSAEAATNKPAAAATK